MQLHHHKIVWMVKSHAMANVSPSISVVTAMQIVQMVSMKRIVQQPLNKPITDRSSQHKLQRYYIHS